jgi:hypothetical protein
VYSEPSDPCKEPKLGPDCFLLVVVIVYVVTLFIPCVSLHKGRVWLGMYPLLAAYFFTGNVVVLAGIHIIASVVFALIVTWCYRRYLHGKRKR